MLVLVGMLVDVNCFEKMKMRFLLLSRENDELVVFVRFNGSMIAILSVILSVTIHAKVIHIRPWESIFLCIVFSMARSRP